MKEEKSKYKENGGSLNRNRKKKKKIEMKIEDKVLQTCCFWGPDGIFESECPTDRW